MKLFKYEGYKLSIADEAYMLKPFKQLIQRDRSFSKERAMTELSYIYFMEDPRSDYQYITDKEDRSNQIKEGLGLKNSWKPDKLVNGALNFYSSFSTSSALLLEDTRIAIDKLRTMLRTIDLTTVDDKGKPVYTLNAITSTIKQIPSLIKDLDEAERAIAKELTQNDKVRGAAEKSMYEDF